MKAHCDLAIQRASTVMQELLPVFDGRVRREEASGAGQGRPGLRGDHVRGDTQPRQPQHGLLRHPGRRLRPLLRRRHAPTTRLARLAIYV